MRIIDKNKDYYDYFQCYDDDIVYDRRGSYVLNNYNICELWTNETKDKYLLLNIGYSYWLLTLKAISTEKLVTGWTLVTDYSLELVSSWKDYKHFNPPSFGIVVEKYGIDFLLSKNFNHNTHLIDYIKMGNYKYIKNLWAMPLIFKNTKIPSVISAENLYNSIDEYFSHLKDEVRVDTMSNEEKIEAHGFDKKHSFRK